jgi:HEPN domain-containing protein
MSEMADRWLAFAHEDLRVAEIALEEGIYNQD